MKIRRRKIDKERVLCLANKKLTRTEDRSNREPRKRDTAEQETQMEGRKKGSYSRS